MSGKISLWVPRNLAISTAPGEVAFEVLAIPACDPQTPRPRPPSGSRWRLTSGAGVPFAAALGPP